MKTFEAWIFDLDGTLTVPMHDFAALKRDLGLPRELDVLAGIATRPPSEHAALHEAVRVWEASHLEQAAAAPGAVELLLQLLACEASVGIVTRNTHATARATLEQIALSAAFPDPVLYGRDDAPAKPDPAAVLALLDRFGRTPEATVFIGDDIHDLVAARRGGVHAVWIDPEGTGRFADDADTVIASLEEALAWVP